MPTRRLILLSLGLSTVLVVVWGSGWLAQDASRDAGRLDVRLTAEAAVPRERAESSRSIEAATDERSPEALRRRGTLRLSRGRAAQAVQDLEEAISLKPRDGRLASDLAAAYLARARERSAPFDLVLALAAADRALQMSPALPEARYNHALVLERLQLRDAARQAWEAYLDLDASSDWARQARTRHAALAGSSAGEEWADQREWLDRATGMEEEIDRIAARFPQETRLYAEEDLLGSWAEAVKTGRSGDAARTLAVARRIGAALAARYGEWMPADTVASIDAAAGDPDRRAALVAGHLAYREARALHESMRPTEARPRLEQARRAFARSGSPAESLAELHLAIGQFQRFLYPPAHATLRRIAGQETSRRSPGLQARVYRTLGLVFIVSGRPADAVDAYRTALVAAQRAGGLEEVAGIHAILAEAFRYLGRPAETWKHLHAGLALTPDIRTPRRLTGLLFEAAEACAAAGRPEAERYFRDASLRSARKAAEPASLTNALLHRASTLFRLGDLAGAERDLAEARWIAEQVRDEPQRLRLQAYLLIGESEIAVRRDPRHALQALTWALEFFRQRENRYFLRRLYLARARAELALGRDDLAEADLRRGIEEYEIERRRVTDEPLRIAFFDQAGSLFDEMMRLQARRPGGAAKAFAYAERERARALLDRLPPLTLEQRAPLAAGAVEPLNAGEIQRALPQNVALVEYAVLDDRLLAWVVRRDDIGFRETRVEAAALDRLVARLRAGLGGTRPAAATPPATALYDLLIRPIQPWLRDQDRIVFVPDRSLNSVPFAALLDKKSGRFLLQDHLLSVAPSATVHLQAVERDRALGSAANPSVLLVANPRFNRELSPGLSDLPQAEREAAAVAALFPGSEVLSGTRATRRNLLAVAGDHEIVHFGGHAVINRDFPLLSHLLMAPEDSQDSGLLHAHQLYAVRLERTRLAVLAACNTADGPTPGEGPLSLARAFLAVGVPGVVASLWQVDDRETSRLLQTFYARLHRGADAAGALRHAQLAMLAGSGRSDGTWAAFQVYGIASGHHPQER